ncbi:hypothetical protein [Actinomycetospora sp. TBRC 11914]|uniref:hypothetical protein n=1 Tax=Actinomycetospora sp. TBRC 11914 TaxID=2729387 RepID=UPI00145F74F0|nr:hypothetical protein [Actinomycetospora sp. TBRC 11914]NMO89883.1 hypothetical protein [Actinomycetospora sp. TBRC 11914]
MSVLPWTPILGSAELVGLLERTDRMAALAGRTDLVERLALARSWMTGRPLRVGVCGRPDAEGTARTRALVEAVRGVSAAWLPGASFGDVPGRHGQDRRPLTEQVDVVLFVTDARAGYGPGELAALTRLRAQDVAVVGVLADHDACEDLTLVLQADRRALRSAGIDDPPIPLLPVSAAQCERGRRHDDRSALIASGIPQLLEVLRDRVDTAMAPRLRAAVLAEVHGALDQLAAAFTAELDRLPRGASSPAERQRRAIAELDRCQQLSANWQIALSDGMAELGAQADFDLRQRLREVLAFADAEILSGRALKDWAGFDAAVRARVEEAVRGDHAMVRERATALAKTVARALAGTADGATVGVTRPRIVLTDPDATTLLPAAAMDVPGTGGGVVSRAVNSLRGSYGGILMVGVLTSLAGLSLISVYSVGAGVLLGVFTYVEDRKNIRERRMAEGRATAAKLLDEANFRAGDHQRAQLRAVHRTLRDHFTAINDERLRAAAEAVRVAGEGGGGSPADHERVAELEAHLADLDDLRRRAGRESPQLAAS